MYFKVLAVFQLMGLTIAINYNIFVTDYFIYRGASYVVGLSCNDAKGDSELMKNFSQAGIYSSFDKLRIDFEVVPILMTKYRRLGVFLDLRCYDSEFVQDLMEQATHVRLFGEQHYWLIIGTNLEDSVGSLNDTEFTMSTDFLIAIVTDVNVMMYDVFNHCKYRGGLLNITRYGTWDDKNGLNVTLLQGKFSRRANLHGMNLRLAGIVSKRPKDMPLEVYLEDYNTKQDDTNAKFAYILWLHLSQLFNFTIEAQELTVWKTTNRNGPLIKKLLERSAELGGSTGIPTPERLAVIIPIPVWPLRTGFIFRTTQSKHIKVNHFLRPLAKATWYLTILLIITAVLVFAWVLVSEDISDRLERYSSAFLFTIGSVCQQGSDLQITHASSRIAFLQTMVFSLLIYNYYSASVVSARLSEPLEKINDSLNELAKTNLKFGAEPSLYFNFFIKRSDWEAQQFYYKKWVKVPEEEKFLPASAGIKRILQGDFAYHIDVNVAYPQIERLFNNEETCQLTMVYLVRPTDSSIFMASNGSFVELAKVGIAKLRELGLRKRLVNRWAAREPQCRTDVLTMDPVTIYETAPAFLLLIFGVVVGLSICTIERLIYCKKYNNHDVKKKMKTMMMKISSLKKKKK
ncbi:hypothetical protein QAD02_004270 [Eretmocerus hayati]|uniref:Uncharacterized protein n=1 Tax=Eretmocerus hayati TaxID=131215 RepID=A0ACC2NRS7_9HYME|nr:hypothetical protein QAD02_004270 [Eretmocerus hayati]